MPTLTLPQLFEESVVRYARNPLLLEKQGDTYTSLTYAQAHEAVHAFGAGLISRGICKGDRIALIAEGRNDWVISELGMFYAGAINVPLSVKLHEGADLQFRLAHAGCRVAVVSASQAAKVRQLRQSLPALECIVMLDPMDQYGPGEIAAAEVMRAGREFLRDHGSELQARVESVRGDDPATISYTSGTTADPKGVVLTHRNYTANVEQSTALLPIPEWYCSLLILPWDHCFAHTAGIYTLMRNGASMASVQVGKTAMETLKNIPTNIRESRPAFLLSVPALAKNFRKGIESAVQQKGRIAQLLFKAGLRVGYVYNADGWKRGKGVRALLKPLVVLFDAVLFSKIRQNFGGRMEFFIGGGALLDIDLQRFFYAIGIPMLQGYGLSEAAPVISANVPARHKLGSSGAVVTHLEIKICSETGEALPVGRQGEIVVRGENVMAGYWRNDRATEEVIRDRWLHTGDLGYLDNDGFLYVLGRTKSLLIAGDGEKYSPEGIEEALCSKSKYIDQIMLYNNQSPFTVALLVPRKDALLAWMKAHHLEPSSAEGQCAVLKRLQREVDGFRSGGEFAGLFPERWLPAAVAVLSDGFTEQNEFLNSTLKMVRGKIAESYDRRIRDLFTAEGKELCSRANRDVIGGWANQF
jgi:long-chain acyl-CoA synthetase